MLAISNQDFNIIPSKSEARRLLQQEAVRINGEKISELGNVHLTEGDILKVGKLKMAKLLVH